jgi:hypothetical protein
MELAMEGLVALFILAALSGGMGAPRQPRNPPPQDRPATRNQQPPPVRKKYRIDEFGEITEEA